MYITKFNNYANGYQAGFLRVDEICGVYYDQFVQLLANSLLSSQASFRHVNKHHREAAAGLTATSRTSIFL
ncbi:MAG TPA: hypothetical protein VKT28_07370 [Puia sp.]|nr:hypothetical protein [Puia sp.]